MDQSSKNISRDKLESQIREDYGKINYSHTAQNKMANRFSKYEDNLKVASIILTAITSGSIIGVLFGSGKIGEIITAVFAIASVVITTLLSTFDFSTKEKIHREAANSLWRLKNEYLSLLIDFEKLGEEEIRKRRDDLASRTFEVYSSFPATDEKAYKETQSALRFNEEQFFEEWEIDVMLPECLRKQSSKVIKDQQKQAKN